MKLSFLSLVYFIVTICFTSVLYSQNEPQFAEGIYYEHYGIEEGLPSNETYFTHQDKDGNMWFTTDRGVVKYDGYDFEVYTEQDGLAELVNLQIIEDPNGGFWIISQTGLLTYWNGAFFKALKTNTYLKSQYESGYFNYIITGIDSNSIYIAPTKRRNAEPIKNKVFQINTKTNTIRTYDSEFPLFGVPSIDLFNTFQKKDYGIVTSNSFNKGDITVFETDSIFITINHLIDSVITFKKNAKDFFLWSDINLNIVASSDTIKFLHPKKTKEIVGIEASSIYKDNANNFWICSIRNGIYKFKVNWNHDLSFQGSRVIDMDSWGNDFSIHLRLNEASINFSKLDNQVDTLFKVGGLGTLRISPTKNFSLLFGRYSYDNKKIKLIFRNQGILADSTIFLFNYDRLNDLLIIDSNTCFLALNNGIVQVNINGRSVEIDTLNFLPPKRYNSLCKENDIIYTCDIDGGLYSFKNKVVYKYRSPLKTNSIDFYNNHLIIGTPKGLLVYEIISEKEIELVSHIDKTFGLSNNYVTGTVVSDSIIIVGTLNGINKFEISTLIKKSVQPKYNFEILNIKSNNQLTKSRDFAKDDFIDIEYKLISQNKLKHLTTYRYRLISPLDNVADWIETDRRNIQYFNLAPGDYTFEVQCRNRSLQWSPSETVEFSILPHSTETKTFQITVLLVFGLLIYGGYSFIYSRRLKEQALISEINEVKMKLTRQQLNPHFIYNALNALQNFIFKDQKEEANRYLKRLSTLIRDSLEFSEMEELPLQREVSFMERYLELEKSRYPDRFDYEIRTNVSSDITEPQVPSLLVQTLAENAIKHGFKNITHKGFLSIQYDCPSPDETSIIVEDNGQGFNGVYDNEGFGLKLIKRRIQIYNNEHKTKKADLTITYQDDDKKSGCIVHIDIHKTPL